MARSGLRQASEEVASRSPEMAHLKGLHGPCRLGTRPRASERFASLARAIAYQQLAGSAASAIWSRVVASVGGACSPQSILRAGEATLRSAGLSGAKTAALLDLADRELAGSLGLGRIGGLGDEAVVDRLVQVRGVGPWTAQMFLMFTLHRLDVWPVGDLGVRKGYSLAFGLPDMPAPAELEVAGERFRPYRSIAAWYCWRACEQV